jgi:ribose transport system ATP-binding protein
MTAIVPSAPLLELRNVVKSFSGVRVLADVDFDVRAGEVHALVGENGAGKSTLIKIMAGVVRPDAGTMELEGRPIALDGPGSAARAGIVSVFQELSLLPDLSVADNICITDMIGQIRLRCQASSCVSAGVSRDVSRELH